MSGGIRARGGCAASATATEACIDKAWRARCAVLAQRRFCAPQTARGLPHFGLAAAAPFPAVGVCILLVGAWLLAHDSRDPRRYTLEMKNNRERAWLALAGAVGASSDGGVFLFCC